MAQTKCLSSSEIFQETAADKAMWKLRRYGRLLPRAKDKDGNSSWKVFESNESTGHLELTVLDSGHLLVSQAQELLEGFSLINAQSFLKIQQKSDSLLFLITLKGESRMVRLQFDGSTRALAVEACRSAVERLQEYLPVRTQENTPPCAPHTSTQPCTEPPAEAASATASNVTQGSLSIKDLTQYFLGERDLSLPLAYRHCIAPPGDLRLLLRLCLLDSSFPAFVEQVEKELRELMQE
ncbi:meiotic recombination protein REC114 [Chanos chanos]|uniref:Meiotic recombination protein REC114 n=1 Tax=Chanos chanos TaxID=29144 RepID=A0A6J2WZ53_CHACN|nr:meiotic recombination protein REC114 [Chanos chanos]